MNNDPIRAAGEQLAVQVVEVPEFSLLTRRRSVVRSIAMMSSVAIIATGFGVAAWVRSPEPSASAVPDPVCAVPGEFELRIDGATALRVHAVPAGTADTVVWVDDLSSMYLTLTVRPGAAEVSPAPSGVGPSVEDTAFPLEQGSAWFTDLDDPSRLGMWWSRTNGDLWLLRAYWYGNESLDQSNRETRLRDLALAIATDDAEPRYHLNDPQMRLMAIDRGGEVESRIWSWGLRADDAAGTTQAGEAYRIEITILLITDSAAAGMSNSLALGKPKTVMVAGCQAWAATDADGDRHIGWAVAGPGGGWATLFIPAALAAMTDQIIAALRVT